MCDMCGMLALIAFPTHVLLRSKNMGTAVTAESLGISCIMWYQWSSTFREALAFARIFSTRPRTPIILIENYSFKSAALLDGSHWSGQFYFWNFYDRCCFAFCLFVNTAPLRCTNCVTKIIAATRHKFQGTPKSLDFWCFRGNVSWIIRK